MNISSLATFLPSRRLQLDEIVNARGGKPSEANTFRKLFGFNEVPCLAEEQSAQQCFSHLIDKAFSQALSTQKIDAIILVQGLPAQSFHQSVDLEEIRRQHACINDHATLFTLNQQNCATLFWGLRLAERLLSSGNFKRIVLLAGDTLADFALSERYVPGCTLIGDAFACAILDSEPGSCNVSDIYCHHRPEFWPGLDGSQEDIRAFYRAHDDLINMVLSHYPPMLREQSWLLPHNINKLTWQTWKRHPENVNQRVATDLINHTGHCYTTDPLLLLESYAPIKTGMSAILLSIGLGGWVGSALITDEISKDNRHAASF